MHCSIADKPGSRIRGRRHAGRSLAWLIASAAILAGCAGRATREDAAAPIQVEPYERETVLREAQAFFGRGAEGLADVVNRVFRDRGDPTGYIKGEEGGGSVGIGLRYGRGTLYLRDGSAQEVFWRGPSIGIDVGGSAAKVFILVYDLPTIEALFTRYGGVEGSLFFVGGVGVNYNRNGETLLAPVRFGVGWRQGVSVGYLHLSPQRSWIPF